MSVRIGFAKLGNIGCAPLIEFLLDERAERQDITVRVFGSGSKLNPEDAVEVAGKLIDFKPNLAILTSPNAALPGPSKLRELVKNAAVPALIITDGAAKKAARQFDGEGFGYFIVEADSMIGARREFLDPIEMSIFNADLLKVLSVTGVFTILYHGLDTLIESLKKGEKPSLPRLVLDKETTVNRSGLQNPYARAKALASYEIAKRVADLTVEGCFVVQERDRYLPLIAAAHEMMRTAGRLADEAREIEKYGDSVIRTPHYKDGSILHKTRLMEKPEGPVKS